MELRDEAGAMDHRAVRIQPCPLLQRGLAGSAVSGASYDLLNWSNGSPRRDAPAGLDCSLPAYFSGGQEGDSGDHIPRSQPVPQSLRIGSAAAGSRFQQAQRR